LGAKSELDWRIGARDSNEGLIWYFAALQTALSRVIWIATRVGVRSLREAWLHWSDAQDLEKDSLSS
jgi:hypothetical protein